MKSLNSLEHPVTRLSETSSKLAGLALNDRQAPRLTFTTYTFTFRRA